MSDLAPLDDSITLQQLDEDPYPIYQRLRNEAPVLRVKATGRTMLTKAEDTKYVKDNPELFSSDDPNTPMKRAFQAHTLMRKDGEAHLRERMAMAPAFSPKVIHRLDAAIYACGLGICRPPATRRDCRPVPGSFWPLCRARPRHSSRHRGSKR